MMRRLAAITLWLLAGDVLLVGLFWSLLQVPESSTATLALSALLVLAMAIAVLWVQGGALAAWRPERTIGGAFRRGLRQSGAVICGALLFGLIWWLTAIALVWHANEAGRIDAWIIARSGHSETTALHQGIVGLIWFLRWGLGLTLAVSLAAAVTADGMGALVRTRWIARAFRPKHWIVVSALIALTFLLPWLYIYWRPVRLSLGVEPWFVGAKLALFAVLRDVGWALILREITPTPPASNPRLS